MREIRPEAFDRYRAAFFAAVKLGHKLPPGQAERLRRIGPGGGCEGELCLEGYERLADFALLYRRVAQQTGVPNPSRVAATMAQLVKFASSGRLVPRSAKIRGEWDGRLAELHRQVLLPRLKAVDQAGFDVRLPHRQAAYLAALRFLGRDRHVAWVAARYMDAEIEGIEPNPFAEYFALR